MKVFYVTTPIYYANSLPHLGHLYTTTVADVITKHKRQRGFDAFFLTGTDEHGINIQRAAEKAGKTPKEQVDYIASELKKMFADFGIVEDENGYSIFMRTTEQFHYEGAQHFWRQIAKNKTPKGNPNIYKGYYEGWFCAPCAAFKTEDEYEVREGAEAPFCLIHEKPLDRVSEESYFFRLSDYSEVLLEIIHKHPEKIRPEARRNEVIAFIERGLQDLSISRERRSVNWGIPVPDDQNHVMYVWLDALSNYITALGYGNKQKSGFEKYWKHAHHLVGKDILRFHTVYWWAFLLAAGLDLPQVVFAHGMWLDAQGRKMGKTLGNVVELDILKKHFQVDAIRYFFLREMVFGQDGNFGYENLIDRVNADLANGLGNLVSRTLAMVEKYCKGRIPSCKISQENRILTKHEMTSLDEQEIVTTLEHARDEFIRRFDNFEFSQALEVIWKVIAKVDKMITDSKPWELAKQQHQTEALNALLYRAVETIRWLAVLLYPVLPDATRRIYRQIGLEGDPAKVNPENLRWGELPEGIRIQKVEAVFPRIDKRGVMNEIMNEAKVEKQEAEDYITIEDFLKVDLRVGEIKGAEKVPDADKLLRLEVDLGEEKPRQILAGLAEYYSPEKLIGRKVVVVANLKPRKIRGLESQGMICAASLNKDDIPAIATFIEEVKNGARLK
ncbi:MAG: methionine--tRNA ligase [Pyrinomonadaceae bacterium]|nr:methionine--tRNA ligase [Pyrinomonadaceae bacterium]MCX7640238.1 methionine--tRNA ligase [Pyrinomonadaceae bacterium]MDW8305138.1 methionine--tRNA ligase [Acidobacteriota bacterium]